MAEKESTLAIVIRTIDKATAGIRAIKERINALAVLTAPIGLIGERIGALGKEAGIPKLVEGFKGVGGAIKEMISRLLVVGGVATVAGAGLVHLVGQFDDMGDLADRLGVHVDFLAQLRFAAERSGASVEQLDQGLQTFSVNLGAARANTGKMVKFLSTVSPALLSQLKATKSTEEGFLLLADAMAKVKDPAKRLKLAAATLGEAALAPLMAQGSKGVAELMDRFHQLAGSQQDAAEKAGAVDDSFKELKASTRGVEAAILSGLAPAMKIVVDKMTAWFVDHREDVKKWAADVGEKIPAAIESVVDWIAKAVKWVEVLVDGIGGWGRAAAVVAAVMAGPLIASIVKLGAVLVATPVGWILAGLAAITAAVVLLVENFDKVIAAAKKVKEVLADLNPFGENNFMSEVNQKLDLAPRRDLMPKVTGESTGTGALLGPSRAVSFVPPPGSAEARVKVDFVNAPKGMRATTDPQSTVDVDLSVGHQMVFGP